MFINNLIAVITISVLSLSLPYDIPGVFNTNLAEHSMPLYNRQPNQYVNDVFKDNILLNLAYMEGRVKNKSDIKWEDIQKPANFAFTLKPGEVFAFHDDVSSRYKGRLSKTTNAHFNFQEGFRSDGYLTGDGVCHLASLIYWTAKNANLETEAPTNHDFAAIADVPKEFGVSIYNLPGNTYSNSRQNLYITNNRSKEVAFNFEYKNDLLKLTVSEAN